MKTILAFLVVAMIAFSPIVKASSSIIFSPTVERGPCPTLGDRNCDGVVDDKEMDQWLADCCLPISDAYRECAFELGSLSACPFTAKQSDVRFAMCVAKKQKQQS